MDSGTSLTADDLWRLEDDEVRRELVNGEIVEMPLPGALHGKYAGKICRWLVENVEAHGSGEVLVGVGFVLNLPGDPERVRGPDVAFVSSERIPEGGLPEKFFRGAPDLAVEVLSSSNTAMDIQQKVRDYLQAGTRMVWVVAPRVKTVNVYRADGSARLLQEPNVLEGEDVLPGLSIPLVKLFE